MGRWCRHHVQHVSAVPLSQEAPGGGASLPWPGPLAATTHSARKRYRYPAQAVGVPSGAPSPTARGALPHLLRPYHHAPRRRGAEQRPPLPRPRPAQPRHAVAGAWWEF